ncbi:MAG: transglycosylase SLT domain-containing protein [Desulfobacteraceae bacterium]|nr:transglycosylase SLT domain-containing protein [Desulfobacteraceae bacterium]
MKKMHLKFCMFLFFLFSYFFSPSALYGDTTLFPVYPSIEPNVKFWTKVYSEYSTAQGVLHDSQNLNIIYEVVELKIGAKTINEKRIQKARGKYKTILKKLAQNPFVSDAEAKRVASLFGKNANRATFQKAIYRIRCQIGQKDSFRYGIIRSGAFMDQIEDIFLSYGLPIDLIYLPHVESSFNLKAYSKFGAAGIWQFVREAGKRFMTVDYAIDERWDPIRSSEAAAQLLKHSYEKFGNWPLAITAYNHGISGMLSATWTKGGYEEIFNHYKSKVFGFASRNYYSEFLAAREVAANYEKYFGKITRDTPVETREIVLAGYSSIKDLGEYFGVDMATLRKHNPSLRIPVFRGQKYVPKGYSLRLPSDAVQNRMGASTELPWNMYKHHQKSSRIYRVKTGDNITNIAKMHGIKVSDLILANKINSKGVIYVNQHLRLPLSGEVADMSETPHLSFAELRQQRTQAPGMTSLRTSSAYEATTPASEFVINPAFVGGNLEVEREMIQKGKPVGIIQVEMGETLGHFAEWLEIPTKIIRRLNRFPYSKTLPLHMNVKIPLDKISKEQFEETRFEYHKKIQEDFFSFYEIESQQLYQLKKGDNVWTICNDIFEMPVWLLKLYNPKVDFNDLRWSQKLVIPVIKDRTQDSPDIVQPSPTVPSKSFEGYRVVRKSWVNSYYPLLFIVLIITFIIHMRPHATDLQQKFKTVFAFIR